MVGAPPGVPLSCRDSLVEVDRWEWRLVDGGDPAAELAAFVGRYGLGLGSDSSPHDMSVGSICGVGLLISADAGAFMCGGVAGAVTPCPEVPDVAAVVFAHGSALSSRRAPHGCAVTGWSSSWSEAQHADAVIAVQEAIAEGTVYQVNVVGHQSARWSGSLQAAVDAVCGVRGSSWSGVLSGAEWTVASGSPECFLIVESGVVSTFPIKGTAPATKSGRVELLNSVKERAEHVMIVDLQRNDISQVSEPGSVAVEKLFALRRWAHLWQAESIVRARLSEGVGFAQLLSALCPPGSVTGTPKLSALGLMASLEPVGRGPAMGALGYLTGQRLALGLTIRTVAFVQSRVHLWAGGGITWRSRAGEEVAEARQKAMGVRRLLGGLVLVLR